MFVYVYYQIDNWTSKVFASPCPKNDVDPVYTNYKSMDRRWCYSEWLFCVSNTTQRVYRQVRLAHFMGDEQKQTRIHMQKQQTQANATIQMLFSSVQFLFSVSLFTTCSVSHALVFSISLHFAFSVFSPWNTLAHVRSHSIIENAASPCNYIFVLSLVTLCFQLCTSSLSVQISCVHMSVSVCMVFLYLCYLGV